MASRRRRKTRKGGDGGNAVALALGGMLAVVSVVSAIVQALAPWWPLLVVLLIAVVPLVVRQVKANRARARAAAARRAELDRQISTTDFMNGGQFEQLVARLLVRDRWEQVRVNGGAGDLGADVTARSPVDGRKLVVQCKRYTTSKVSSPDMQRFLGTVFHHHRADVALYVTTSSFTRPAAELGHSQGVFLADRELLAAWMAGHRHPFGPGSSSSPWGGAQLPNAS